MLHRNLARSVGRGALIGGVIAASVSLGGVNPAGAVPASAEEVANYVARIVPTPPIYADANTDAVIDVADVVSLMNIPNGLGISDLSFTYSAPYLLDMNFTMRDADGLSVVIPPSLFEILALESLDPISPTETGSQLAGARSKQLRTFLVLDYTLSMADTAANGDSDGDGMSDALETMEEAAKIFIDSLNVDGQVGIYEFHRDSDPRRVSDFSLSRPHLHDQIDRIWTDHVQMFPGSSRCWDAVYAALEEFGEANLRDEQRFLIFLSDGRDESSFRTPDDIIILALLSGVKIYCVGFGAELDPAPLERITDLTHGEYYEASTVDQMRDRFRQIIRDLGGQYTLRWATLKRTEEAFAPSFEVALGDFAASEEAWVPYVPTAYAGNPFVGVLRFVGTEVVDRTATVFLRAEYVPRFIRRIRLTIRTDLPFAVEAASSAGGGLIPTWDVTRDYDHGEGLWVLDMENPDPSPFTGSIPYASFGPILRFEFRNLDRLSDLFPIPRDVAVDNSIYASTGGQAFVISNAVQFFDRNSLDAGLSGATDVTTADLDSDGNVDVIASAWNAGRVTWYQNLGFGTFRSEDLGGTIGMNSVRALDGTGGCPGETFASSAVWNRITRFHWEIPPGGVECDVKEEYVTDDTPDLACVDVADFDLDGDLDVVGSGGTGSIFWFESDGQGNYSRRTVAGGFDGVNTVVAVDLDQDGETDVVAAAADEGALRWWRNRSEVFTAQTINDHVPGASDLQVIDMDLDGDLDIVGCAKTDGLVGWWENDGLTGFTTRLLAVDFTGADSVAAGDMDGDGDIDVVASSSELDSIWWWSNGGNQNFSRGVIETEFLGVSSVHVADIDGDGDEDLFATARGGNELAWWESRQVWRWD